MVVDAMATQELLKTLLKNGNTTEVQIIMVLHSHNHDCGEADIIMMIMRNTLQLFS